MGTFDSIYLNKIKQLQEENRRLRYALQEAQNPPRNTYNPLPHGLRRHRLRKTPPHLIVPGPKGPGSYGYEYGPGPGSFGHGYGQPALKPGQTLPGSGTGPSGAGTFGEGY